MTAAKSASSKPEIRSSILLAELERLAGHHLVLKHLLQRKARPTADDYICLQWWGASLEDIDEEEQEIIALLKELEQEQLEEVSQ